MHCVSAKFIRVHSCPFVVAVFLGALLTGCAGYQLGPTNGTPAGSRSIQVNLFRNDTWEPRLTDPVATSLRRWIQRDGTYRLATHGDGDIIVDGVITRSEERRVGKVV